jgi:hypothetical protein
VPLQNPIKNKTNLSLAHTYNLSYSAGRDQEDCGLKSAGANSMQDPILKNPSQKGLEK